MIAKAEPGCLVRIAKGEQVGTLFAINDGVRIGKSHNGQGDNEAHMDPLYSGITHPSKL